jgi:hypothetical protein|tara:strand:+ start:51 stop:716 length:666 start_codon:yes stop_codon:yes gene_type:complete
MAIKFKECPRDGGDLYPDRDMYGPYEECFQCGHVLYPKDTVREERLSRLVGGSWNQPVGQLEETIAGKNNSPGSNSDNNGTPTSNKLGYKTLDWYMEIARVLNKDGPSTRGYLFNSGLYSYRPLDSRLNIMIDEGYIEKVISGKSFLYKAKQSLIDALNDYDTLMGLIERATELGHSPLKLPTKKLLDSIRKKTDLGRFVMEHADKFLALSKFVKDISIDD